MADQGSEGLLSPFLRKYRMQMVKPYLQGKVLDVGCGSGKLAEYMPIENYSGVDTDLISLNIANNSFPGCSFYETLSNVSGKFDVVVALAVVEHVKNPSEFLSSLSQFLKTNDASRIVITTPHPSADWIHDMGARIGLFSSHANEEHEELLDREKLEIEGRKAGLRLAKYESFLLGVNQLVVYERFE